MGAIAKLLGASAFLVLAALCAWFAWGTYAALFSAAIFGAAIALTLGLFVLAGLALAFFALMLAVLAA